MFRNMFFGLYFLFLFICFSSGYKSHWMAELKTPRQLNVTNEISEEGKETTSENLLENSTAAITEDEILFWTVPESNRTTEGNVIVQMDNQEMVSEEALAEDKNGILDEKEKEEAKDQDISYVETQQTETTDIDEKIVLQRMNCHLEMAVEDTQDLKMQIKFAQLQNNTSGKCCITLSGPDNTQLAILISGIHFYQNGSDGEVLQVIVVNHGVAFVLKEYHHWSKYEPLLLTEAHKVYLVLHYKVTTISMKEQESYFNLEVLTYHKFENQIKPNIKGYSTGFSQVKV